MHTLSQAIQIEDLTVIYNGTHPQRTALDRVSCTIPRAGWTAVVGSNGSGKSTLAKTIAGLYRPSAGRIHYSDQTKVHIVLQNPETQMLGETVEEELRLSLNLQPGGRGAELLIDQALDQVGLSLTPQTRTSQLSGGQKQLVHIASCLVAKASVLVLDEAVAMLDPASRKSVLEAVRQLHGKGTTIVWVTHRADELGYADHVLLLEHGKLVFDGSSRAFVYGDSPDSVSPCEQWGMTVPYTVQVAKELWKRGYCLRQLPLLPEQLSSAVKSHAASR